MDTSTTISNLVFAEGPEVNKSFIVRPQKKLHMMALIIAQEFGFIIYLI